MGSFHLGFGWLGLGWIGVGFCVGGLGGGDLFADVEEAADGGEELVVEAALDEGVGGAVFVPVGFDEGGLGGVRLRFWFGFGGFGLGFCLGFGGLFFGVGSGRFGVVLRDFWLLRLGLLRFRCGGLFGFVDEAAVVGGHLVEGVALFGPVAELRPVGCDDAADDEVFERGLRLQAVEEGLLHFAEGLAGFDFAEENFGEVALAGDHRGGGWAAWGAWAFGFCAVGAGGGDLFFGSHVCVDEYARGDGGWWWGLEVSGLE